MANCKRSTSFYFDFLFKKNSQVFNFDVYRNCVDETDVNSLEVFFFLRLNVCGEEKKTKCKLIRVVKLATTKTRNIL